MTVWKRAAGMLGTYRNRRQSCFASLVRFNILEMLSLRVSCDSLPL